MALIAAHLNAGHSGGDSVAIGIYPLPLPPPPYPLPPIFPIPNKPYGFCVKHHVYLLYTDRMNSALSLESGIMWVGTMLLKPLLLHD